MAPFCLVFFLPPSLSIVFDCVVVVPLPSASFYFLQYSLCGCFDIVCLSLAPAAGFLGLCCPDPLRSHCLRPATLASFNLRTPFFFPSLPFFDSPLTFISRFFWRCQCLRLSARFVFSFRLFLVSRYSSRVCVLIFPELLL